MSFRSDSESQFLSLSLIGDSAEDLIESLQRLIELENQGKHLAPRLHDSLADVFREASILIGQPTTAKQFAVSLGAYVQAVQPRSHSSARVAIDRLLTQVFNENSSKNIHPMSDDPTVMQLLFCYVGFTMGWNVRVVSFADEPILGVFYPDESESAPSFLIDIFKGEVSTAEQYLMVHSSLSGSVETLISDTFQLMPNQVLIKILLVAMKRFYVSKDALESALRVSNWILVLDPSDLETLHDRVALLESLDCIQAALADLHLIRRKFPSHPRYKALLVSIAKLEEHQPATIH